MNQFRKIFLISSGFISIGLGIIGIFLPVLPTTPFLLLAAICFSKSSPSLYQRLIHNRWVGKYIADYRQGKGIPMRGKLVAITFLWVTILLSAFYFTNLLLLKILLLLIAFVVSYHIGKIKTAS